MLQIHKFLNTAELERLHREDELPKGDIVATACRYMASRKGSILLLLRDGATWDVHGVFVDIPDEDDRLSRNIYTIFCDVDKVDVEYFRTHLRDNHFRIAEVHVPATTQLTGEFSTWRIMRHKRQAVGELKRVKLMDVAKVEDDVAKLAAHGETSRLEVHLSQGVRKANEDLCQRLTKFGFVTRKYIYHVLP